MLISLSSIKSEGKKHRYCSSMVNPSSSSCVRELVNDSHLHVCIQRREGEQGTCLLFKDTFQEAGSFVSAWVSSPEPSHVVMPTCSKILELSFLYWVVICPAKMQDFHYYQRKKKSRMVNWGHILDSALIVRHTTLGA